MRTGAISLLLVLTACHVPGREPQVIHSPEIRSSPGASYSPEAGDLPKISHSPSQVVARYPGEHAVAFAQQMRGKPYCWGGTGPKCFDCSGLTYAAWKAAGRTIPRTSSAQSNGLAPVSWDRVQAGDIVWRPGHVGLYVGNGWAIHAPSSGKVVQYQPVNKYRRAYRPR